MAIDIVFLYYMWTPRKNPEKSTFASTSVSNVNSTMTNCIGLVVGRQLGTPFTGKKHFVSSEKYS